MRQFKFRGCIPGVPASSTHACDHFVQIAWLLLEMHGASSREVWCLFRAPEGGRKDIADVNPQHALAREPRCIQIRSRKGLSFPNTFESSLFFVDGPQLREEFSSKDIVGETLLSRAVESGNIGLFRLVRERAWDVLDPNQVGGVASHCALCLSMSGHQVGLSSSKATASNLLSNMHQMVRRFEDTGRLVPHRRFSDFAILQSANMLSPKGISQNLTGIHRCLRETSTIKGKLTGFL